MVLYFKKDILKASFFVLLSLFSLVLPHTLFSQNAGDYRTNATGTWNWSTVANWQRYNGASWVAAPDYPGQNAGALTVNILGAANTTINLDVSPANVIDSLSLSSSTANISHTLNFNGFKLDVTKGILIANNAGGTQNQTIAVGSGTLTCALVDISGTQNNNNRKSYLTLSTGLIDCAGDITLLRNQNRNYLQVTGAGTLQIGGEFNLNNNASLSLAAGSTVDYTSASAQNVLGVTYANLRISNVGARVPIGNVTVSENFEVAAGSFDLFDRTFTVNGISTISGLLQDTDNSNDQSVFVGKITVTASGTWNTTANTNTNRITFQGGFENNNTTANSVLLGRCSFNTISQNVSGVGPINFTDNVDILGAITITNTNTDTVYFAGSVTGDNVNSEWENDDLSILKITTANAPMATGIFNVRSVGETNTVIYTAAGANVRETAYSNLVINTSTTASIAAATSVYDNLYLNNGTFSVGAFLTSENASTITRENGNLSAAPTFSGIVNVIYLAACATGPEIPDYSILPTALNDLTLNTSGGNVTLANHIIVNGIFAWSSNGLMVLGAFDLTMATGASFLGNNSSRFIQTNGTGNLIKEGTVAGDFEIVYPVGTSTNYTPMDITSVASGGFGAPGNVSVRAVGSRLSYVPSNNNAITKYWDVTSSFAVTTVDVNFTFVNPAELVGSVTLYEPRIGDGVAIAAVTGPSAAGSTPTFSSTGHNTLTGHWTYVDPTVRTPKTYYTYQSGNWATANVWTEDPSGTTLVNPAVPGSVANDNVVILNGRTVTTAIARSVNSVEIRAGGTLDIGTTTGHNFGTMSGAGTLKVNSAVLPGGLDNSSVFVSSAGGTIEYYDWDGNLFSDQTTYNNLIISNSTGTNHTLVFQNPLATTAYTLNGNLTTSATGAGFVDLKFGHTATNVIQMGIAGNVTNGANCNLTVGNFNAIHTVTVQGNFTNNGSVVWSNSAQWVASTNGAVNLVYTGTSNKSMVCNGQTDIYSLTVDMGTDDTYILDITASATPNFKIFTNGQNITLTKGTLKLGAGVQLLRLGLNSTQFNVNLGCRLWIDGADVNGSGYDNGIRANQGTLQITSGNFEFGNNGLNFNNNGTILIEGGTTTVETIMPGGGGAADATFIMTGGVLNVDGSLAGNPGGNNDLPQFCLTDPNVSLTISGGTINVYTTKNSARLKGAAVGIGSNNYNITGGTWNFYIPASDIEFGVASTAPFYDLNIYKQGAGASVVKVKRIGGDFGLAAQPLVVLHDLYIDGTNNPILDANGNDVTVGGNFTISAGGDYRPNINTTTFNGPSTYGRANQTFDINAQITSKTNLTVNKASGTLSLAGANDFDCLSGLTLTQGTLADGGKNINVCGNIANSATHSGAGSVRIQRGVNSANATAGGAYALPSITVPGTPTTHAVFSLTIKDGVVADVTVVSGGAGYGGNNTHQTTVAGGTGAGLDVGCEVVGNVVVNAWVNAGGAGYGPTASGAGGGGAGAIYEAVVSGNADNTGGTGALTAVNILSPGTGYTSNPTISISVGAGTASAITTDVPVISGSGSGTFTNLDQNNDLGSIFSANQTVNGDLRLAQGIMNISSYNLSLSGTSNIYDALAGTGTTFSSTKMIQTGGLGSNSGVTKMYSASMLSFTYPVGSGGKYTPGTITLNAAPSVYGSINVRPVDAEHPLVSASGQSLTYYWKVSSSGLTLGAATVTHTYVYDQTDVVDDGLNVLETEYVPGRYNPSLITWTTNSDMAKVDEATNTITFDGLDFQATIDGDYTAGDQTPSDPFSAVLTFYSLNGGTYDWNDPTAWSIDGVLKHIGAPAGITPTSNSVVKIGDGALYNHTVTVDANAQTCGAMTIALGSALDLGVFTGHDFGSYVSGATGDGLLRISSALALAEFPSGDLSDFLDATGGTVEYYTTGAQGFTIPTTSAAPSLANINTYMNLVLTPATGNFIEMPDNNLTVYTDLTVQGASATALALFNSASAKTLNVNGDIDLTSGNLKFMNGFAQNIIVGGNVVVANGAVFDIENTATAIQNTLSITESLTNNGTFNMVNGTDVCNVTFTGNTNESITGTNAGAVTTFNKLIINKGTSQTSILNLDVDGTLTTPTTNWLTLTNGTFRVSKAATITIEDAAGYTIESTVCLSLNEAAAVVNVCYGNNSTYDLQLNGKIEIIDGILNVGTTTNNHQDIQYASTGTPEIDIQAGTLNVNGQIRRTTSVAGGDLIYSQSGGDVLVRGRNSSAARGRFEVLNNGSFTMSAGTITLLRRGSTLGDLYLSPAASSVTGGTIIFGTQNINANRDFTLYSTIALHNITVSGVDANDLVNVDLNITPLTVNGTLDITNDFSAFRANSLAVTFSETGVLVNSNTDASIGVAVGGYQAGSTAQITTFNSAAANQTITGVVGNNTNFGSLVINNTFGSVSLAANTAVRVNGDLTLSFGTFADGGNTATIIGNVANSATHSGAGKILMQGSVQQVFSGSGTGVFENVELDNVSGFLTTSNQTVNGTLTFTNGILDIDDDRLTFGASASVGGTPDATKKILTNGVLGDLGVLKHFNAGAGSFTFPVSGSSAIYTPASFNITANGSAGTITIRPVNAKHPSTQDPASLELLYYWNTSSTGFSGLTVDHSYVYDQSDVQGTETNYVTGRFFALDWVPVHGYPGTVNDATNTMALSGVNFLDGDFTAGESDGATTFEFNALLTYYSRNATSGGNWDNVTSWSTDAVLQHAGAPAVVMPDGNPIIIANSHTITANGDIRIAASTDLLGTAVLDLADHVGHNLGVVTGTGKLKIRATGGGSFIIPSGNYTAFTANGGGTVEFGGAVNGTILPTLSTYNNVEFDGTSAKIIPSGNYVINGDFTIIGGTVNNAPNNANFTIAGNWTNNSSGAWVSGSSSTVTFNGTAAQSIGGTTASAFNNLVINNTSGTGITLNAPVTVKSALTLTNGKIFSSAANLLTLNDNVTSTAGSANSFVSGPMKKIGNDAFVFPVGKGNLWRRIGITAPASTTTEFTAEYFNSPYVDVTTVTAPLNNVSSGEYWMLDRAVTANAVRVTLYWEDAGHSGITNCADLRVARWNGASWVEHASTASGTCSGTGTGSVQTNATVSSFSPFAFGSASGIVNPLPIELLSFTAQLKEDKKVYLNWITATEINNDYFTVEKTKDGINFESVLTLPGAGNSSVPLSYDGVDAFPYAGVSYYRLKQVDFDGNYSYSPLVSVNNELSSEFSIYPNPLQGGELFVSFDENITGNTLVVILDILGKEVFKESVYVNENNLTAKLNVSDKLPSGVYFVRILSPESGSQYVQRLVVK